MEGDQKVDASWDDLGIEGSCSIQNVWSAELQGMSSTDVSATLGEGESRL